MKVIEKLFIHYLQTNGDEHVNKYLAARAILEITDRSRIKEINDFATEISDRFPLSIYKASRFLSSKETKLLMTAKNGQRFEINKYEGDDYRLREDMGRFIEKVNALVVDSMDKYNSDRARLKPQSEFDLSELDELADN